MFDLLKGILRSFAFQVRTRLKRRATERTWQNVKRTPYKLQRFATVTLASPGGGTIFTNTFLGEKIKEKYDVKSYHLHTSTPQKFARIDTKDSLRDFPIIPDIYSDRRGFAVVAVFYFEWKALQPWLTHYRNQGAAHFFLYFNANVIPEELQNTVNEATDVTLIIFPFLYFSSTWRYNSGHFFQSAQPIALQHALEIIKNRTSFRYVLTCDLDEYIIGEGKIFESLQSSPKEISFANFWSRGYENFINGDAPFIAKEIEWKPWTRVKSIVDTARIQRLDVHRIWDEDNLDTSFMMLHFKDIPKRGWIDPFRNGIVFDENIRIDNHPSNKATNIWFKYLLNSKKK